MSYDPDEIEENARRRVGSVLNAKWTLERLLGLGGMAAVYAGKHRNGARAAVKVLHAELARHKEIRDRFLREGYAANRVEHPGAVAVLDDDVVQGGTDDGAAYIVMELLEGEPLEARAARQPLDERELLEVADGILEVLESAHARGVVHRDLKPDNLFVLCADPGDGGPIKIKVLDFGLARMELPDEARTVTRHGVTIGTPAYMSPEQAAGRADEIDGRADIFSLGAVMYRLRTGKRIHEASHPVELVAKMAKFPAPRIRDVDASVSPPFAAIVDRALAFERLNRYPDAASMRADVRAALGPKLEPHVVNSSRDRMALERTELASEDLSDIAGPKQRSSFPFFGLLLLGLVGAGAFFFVRDGHLPFTSAFQTATGAPPAPSASSLAPEAFDAGAPTPSDASLAAVSVAMVPSAISVDATPVDGEADATADADEEDDEDEDAGADSGADETGSEVGLDAATPTVVMPTSPSAKASASTQALKPKPKLPLKKPGKKRPKKKK